VFTLERRIDLDEVAATQQLAARVLRLDDTVALERLRQRRQPLLAVQEEELRRDFAVKPDTFYGTWLEANLCIAGVEQHHDTQRMTAEDRDQKLPDPLVIPFVASLEIRQLQVPGFCPREVLVERVLRRLESHSRILSTKTSL